jgi:hypothetical protein
LAKAAYKEKKGLQADVYTLYTCAWNGAICGRKMGIRSSANDQALIADSGEYFDLVSPNVKRFGVSSKYAYDLYDGARGPFHNKKPILQSILRRIAGE